MLRAGAGVARTLAGISTLMLSSGDTLESLCGGQGEASERLILKPGLSTGRGAKDTPRRCAPEASIASKASTGRRVHGLENMANTDKKLVPRIFSA